ncbi:unnamed protein product [Cyclocybe aegerita]|uniref:Uncharacterized protein n=1 Tax=Cyclocybe aegerita TaxID=1973307 RepID=A0A8S0WJ72_CYCAE|nr:unnamed protein product [Cyclocybe aegerita]
MNTPDETEWRPLPPEPASGKVETCCALEKDKAAVVDSAESQMRPSPEVPELRRSSRPRRKSLRAKEASAGPADRRSSVRVPTGVSRASETEASAVAESLTTEIPGALTEGSNDLLASIPARSDTNSEEAANVRGRKRVKLSSDSEVNISEAKRKQKQTITSARGGGVGRGTDEEEKENLSPTPQSASVPSQGIPGVALPFAPIDTSTQQVTKEKRKKPKGTIDAWIGTYKTEHRSEYMGERDWLNGCKFSLTLVTDKVSSELWGHFNNKKFESVVRAQKKNSSVRVGEEIKFYWCAEDKSGLKTRKGSVEEGTLTFLGDGVVKEVYHNEADTYLDQLIWWLAINHNIAISQSALHKNLQDAGLTRKLLHKIAKEQDEEVQAEFMEVIHDHSAGTGDEFLFIDEMSKNDHDTARHYGLALSGQQADFIDNFVCGDRYSMAASMSTEGYISTHVVPGSFNADEFRDYIVEQVLPETNPYPGR